MTTTTDEIRIFSATGMLGAGFRESSLERALTWDPHVLGCDAGSTDGGALALGTATPHHSRPTTERDLRLLLRAGRAAKIPVIIGSAGSGGCDDHVEWMLDIVRDIARDEDLSFRLAAIYTEQSKDYLKERLDAGQIRRLSSNVDEMSTELIDRATHIVGAAGIEPYVEALEGGADVIIGGRSTDTAIFASFPSWRGGFDEGAIWHAAKILECGAACAENRLFGDAMFCRLRPDHFLIEPPASELRVTPTSVASHSFYETVHPYLMPEPSGTIDMGGASYTMDGDRAVRVEGSAFHPADEYTIKLEGAELVGYQSFAIGGIRDPVIIAQIRPYLTEAAARSKQRVQEILGTEIAQAYHLNFRLYGIDGVMGPLEPEKDTVPKEIGVLIEVTAPTQDLANEILRAVRKGLMHQSVKEYSGSITSLAFPTSAEYNRGAIYRFSLNHVVHPEKPEDMFRLNYETV